MVISQRLMRLFQSHQHFLLYVDVYAHRRASVRASVSEASRAILSQSVSLRDLLLTAARENGIKPKTAAEKKRQKGCCYRFRSCRTYMCRRPCKAWL